MIKTPEELRRWLEQRLKTSGNFDVLWRQLDRERYIGEFCQGDIDEEEILRVAREKLVAARELVGGRTSNSQGRGKNEKENEPDEEYFEVSINAYEQERARAYEEISAREAALNQGPDGSFVLTDWRRKVLGEKLLSVEEAQDLLESPAARFLPLDLFKQWGIPVAVHTSKELAYDYGADKPYVDHRTTIEATPPGVTKTVWYSNAPDGDTEPDARWYCSDGKAVVEPLERVLEYRDRDGLKEKTWVWPASVLDSLRSMSARWARMLGWEKEDMTMWLLTGEPFAWDPLKAKLSVKIGRPLTVSLDVHPWMSADTVASNYRKIQRQLFGQENRQLKPRSLAVLRFVEGRIKESGGVRPSWSGLLDEWNGRCLPEWRYYDKRNLARAYKKALRSVAHSSVALPMLRTSPAAKRKAERLNAEVKEALTRTFGRFVEHGYTTTRYDLYGNLLPETEQPKELPGSKEDGNKN